MPASEPATSSVKSKSSSPTAKPTASKQPEATDSSKSNKGKDAKKEKRAAAVAARAAAGGAAGGAAESSKEATSSIGSVRRGSAQAGPSSNVKGNAKDSATAAQSKSNNATGNSTSATSNPSPLSTHTQNLLFSHLPSSTVPSTSHALNSAKIHPLVIRYGLLISTGKIRGANARCIGLMSTFKEVVRDFRCPAEEMSRLLPSHLSPMIAFLDGCRPKGVGGGNAIRWLKSEINRITTSPLITEQSIQKSEIIASIDEFLRDRIELADQVICDFAVEKIRNGDTILTYARSSIVEQVLLEAWNAMQERDENESFIVIVVDSRPLLEGKQLLKILRAAGIPSIYTLLPSLPSVLPRSNLVLLGTSALLSDGSLYSRAGTAMVALLAKESRVPVVACCETYKFGEKVVLDAVTGNELGDTSGFWKGEKAEEDLQQGRKNVKAVHVTPVHLLYDLTPPGLITAVCTEVGFIPPSSVPTVITA